ncbi:MAG: nuclear transport factor 2 family protein [Flavobacteriaceae bacterium]|nr:nuclear transport factor 2 family protein [Flavobacteriaceae bacterium]
MKKIIQFVSFLTIAAFTFSGCMNQQKAKSNDAEPIDMANLKVEIQAMEDAFSAGEKAKDADAVVAYYSENAISYSRNKQPTSGRAAIRESIAKSIANDTLGEYSVYKVVDLFAEGNSALEVGSWTQFDSTGTEIENGYYMSYFEKKDGKYECVRDMNVSTKPRKEGM